MEVKCLSVKQPYAWLIVNGFKDIENRTWNTKFRGKIYIHASKTVDLIGVEWINDNFPEVELPKNYDLGCIVGYTTITDCVTSHKSKWFEGTYGFVLKDSSTIKPIPYKGQLGIFNAEI